MQKETCIKSHVFFLFICHNVCLEQNGKESLEMNLKLRGEPVSALL